MSKQLLNLVNQAQDLIAQIRQHPHFKHLDYHPDVTLGDASMALGCLQWELQTESDSVVDLSKLEAFKCD